jgi:hypothetical protein
MVFIGLREAVPGLHTSRPYPEEPGRPVSAAASALRPWRALGRGVLVIFNTDQGVRLNQCRCGLSGSFSNMDRPRRMLDNIFVKRLWRTVRCEDSYLRLRDPSEPEASLHHWRVRRSLVLSAPS